MIITINTHPNESAIMSKGGKGGGRSRSPNDDRSDSMNPNNPAYEASVENRSDQLNPNNPEYKGDDEEEDEEKNEED